MSIKRKRGDIVDEEMDFDEEKISTRGIESYPDSFSRIFSNFG